MENVDFKKQDAINELGMEPTGAAVELGGPEANY